MEAPVTKLRFRTGRRVWINWAEVGRSKAPARAMDADDWRVWNDMPVSIAVTPLARLLWRIPK